MEEKIIKIICLCQESTQVVLQIWFDFDDYFVFIPGKPPIFGFNIKNKESSRKKLYSFFYLEEEPLTNKIETISKCLYISNQTPDGKSPQDYVLKDIPRERLSIDAICKPNSEKQPSDIKNMASKAVRSVMKKTPKNKNHRRSSSCSKATGLKLVL